ncbi:hypothetical protein ACMD2_15566 [Ananas comosus]|uniref:Pentatricopeptide repeat-containing protein n=1 Tax=Ananas comosus TaxID=4615 RepID=A0A199UY14_ANACO|nr:hypothetical protein ACMD2_15566 [Ananas comosus]
MDRRVRRNRKSLIPLPSSFGNTELLRLEMTATKMMTVDEELDELIFRIKLRRWEHGVWKSRFMGETLNIQDKTIDAGDPDTPNMLDDDVVEDVAKEAEENEADEEEEVVEQTESQVEVGDISKDKEVERAKPLQMIAIQLLKDSEETNTTKKSQRAARASVEDDDDEDWFPEDVHEAFKVIELGGMPTIGDCATILRAAIRAPLPSTFLTILQTTIVILCLDLGEVDAAIAIVADMETGGIKVADQTLDKVLSARQSVDSPTDESSIME